MSDYSNVTTHRSPAGLQVDPAGRDTTYTSINSRSGGSSFGFLVGAGIAIIAILLAFLFLAGPDEGATVGTGGETATESVVVPEDATSAPVDQSVAPADGVAVESAEPAAPADDPAPADAAPADDAAPTAN